MISRRISRRDLLKISLGSSVLLLAACTPAAQQPAPAAQPTSAPAAQATAAPAAQPTRPPAAQATQAPQAAQKGGTLRYAISSNPADFDPHTTGSLITWHVLEQVYERLTVLDKNQNPQPWLAESWQISQDGTQYTFKLRPGVKFHNGRAVTSADVKNSFDRIRDPKTPSVAKPYFGNVEEIATPDDSTVIIKQTKPFAAFLYALARLETAIVPKEEVEKQNNSMQTPVGTGPFKFVEFKKDVETVLERNPDYWNKSLPILDKVIYRPITDADVRLTNLRTGEVEIVQDVPAKDVAGLKNDSKVVVVQVNGTLWPHVSMNTRKAPFDDVRVRQAVHYALDRHAMLELINFGIGVVSESPLPPGNPFRIEIPEWKTDRAKAKQLLAEAGHPNGFNTTMRVIGAANGPHAEVAQAQLREVGINVQVEKMESTAWFKEVFTEHMYDMSLVAHASKIDPDISFWDILHKDGPKNYTGTNIPELNKLLDDGRTTVDEAKRKEIYSQVQKILVEQSGYVVLYLPPYLYGRSPNVVNGDILPTGDMRFWETSLK